MNPTRVFKQKVTYWSVSGIDKYGKPSFATPITVKGRWEDKVETFRDEYGKETVSKAKVYIQDGTNVTVDSYLYLGVSTAVSPLSVDGPWEVQAAGRIPNLRNLTSLFMAYL